MCWPKSSLKPSLTVFISIQIKKFFETLYCCQLGILSLVKIIFGKGLTDLTLFQKRNSRSKLSMLSTFFYLDFNLILISFSRCLWVAKLCWKSLYLWLCPKTSQLWCIHFLGSKQLGPGSILAWPLGQFWISSKKQIHWRI